LTAEMDGVFIVKEEQDHEYEEENFKVGRKPSYRIRKDFALEFILYNHIERPALFNMPVRRSLLRNIGL